MSFGLEPEVPASGPVDTLGSFVSTLARGPPRVAISARSIGAKPTARTKAKRTMRVRMRSILLPPVRGQPHHQKLVMEIHCKMVMTMKMMRTRKMISLTPN